MTIACAALIGFFALHGYAMPQRLAVADIAWQESRCNPRVISPEGDFGTFQHKGPRKRALIAFAGRLGHAWTDRWAQYAFADREWRLMPASRAFFAARDRRTAARIFCRAYEVRACR